MTRLALVRHGQSQWNLENRFTGWVDVDLTEKGEAEAREAGAALRAFDGPFDYRGFVEGDDVGQGAVDVVVCEGFSGNIALKTAEGTAKQIGEYLRAAMNRSLMARIGAVFAHGAFRALKDKMDPRHLNGGVFLGLNGIVIKSHGGTDPTGFASAIDLSYDVARAELVARTTEDVAACHATLTLDRVA